LIIEEDEDLPSFVRKASEEVWDGEKTGKRLFFSTGMEIRRRLDAVREGDTLYISEGEDWIDPQENKITALMNRLMILR